MSGSEILQFLQHLQGVANDIANTMTDFLAEADVATVVLVQAELVSFDLSDPIKAVKRLKEFEKKLYPIRAAAFEKAKSAFLVTAGQVGSVSAGFAAKEIEAALQNELDIRRKLFNPAISPAKIDGILNYTHFRSGPNGADTIGGWFKAWQQNDLHRIVSKVKQATVEGLELGTLIRQIRGWKDNKGIVHEGIAAVTHKSARTVARTLINGVANAGKMEMYRQNADVIDGVKWLATLDTRACPVCANLDGRIWTPDQMDTVTRPPAHPGCRCTMVPYIDLGPEFEGTRPAEVRNFDLDAEEKYNKERDAKIEAEKKPGKPWNELTYETRKKKRYEEINAYEKKHGEGTAYRQVKSSTDFREHFETLSARDQREWLGADRYEGYRLGTLKTIDLTMPDNNYVRSVDDLRQAGLIPEKNRSTRRSQAKKGETKDRIESAADVEKYLRFAETGSQRKESREIERLETLLKEMELAGRQGDKEYGDATTWLNKRQNKRAEQDRRTIHEHIAPVSGEITRAAEIKFENDLCKRIKTPSVMAEGKDGLRFATKIIDTYDIAIDKPLPKFVSKRSRAEYDGDSNVLDIGRRAGIRQLVPHEMGHYIEEGNREIQKRCKDFFERITDGSEVRSLKKDFPKDGYSDDEKYKPANISMPEYATKINPGGSTEILSVGLQELQRDPVGFSRNYPEFFDFIIQTIRSTKNE